MQRGGLTIAPGAYDCITARSIAQAGFAAVYMTGAGTAATLGYPDYGLVTMSEMADNAGRIAAAVDVPVIADADTGYGNELNATRTVREYERRGVAGLHIEDQGFPKKCGHLDNKVIVPLDEYLAKIRAAVAARTRSGLLHHCAHRQPRGARASKRRSAAPMRRWRPAPTWRLSRRRRRWRRSPRCRRLVKGRACSMWCGAARRPEVAFGEAERMGYRLAIVPGMLFKAVIGVCDATLAELSRTDRHPVPMHSMTVREAFRRVGADEWDAISERFGAAKPPPAEAAE